VVLKLASTLDGRIATASGESRWITGPEARAVVQRLRAATDAVMVGSETALADDPELAARVGRARPRHPVRVLVDGGLRVPAGARLYRQPAGEAWVLCTRSAAARRRRALEGVGARVLEVPARRGRVDLRRALRRLAREGLTELLVEGGGGLAAALLAAELVDEVHWFSAPRLLGSDGRPALGPLGVRRLARAPELAVVSVRRVGRDVHLIGRLDREHARGTRA
jgi:diaminohydroxyphosphoribosylaminopyrimidine deaminase / 5-amino-6-(5-phosphoribosylamino)uracil reductase